MSEHYCVYKDGMCELDVDEAYEQGKADMLDKIILAEKSKFYCDELSCNEFKNCSDCMVKYLEELKEQNNEKRNT